MKAQEWGLRCVHEAKMWPHNCFVTLTYNDEMMPLGGSLSVRDCQLFMKRLRKSREPSTIRFFLGAEYGDTNQRPHYHALLFNVQFPDCKPWSKNARGETLYRSAELDNLWSNNGVPMGFCTIGELTMDSAIYCAKYTLKRIVIKDDAPPEIRARHDAKYVVYDADGVVHERTKEFALMSRRPGIGAGYYEKYGSEVLTHDNLIVNGRAIKPPRFYDLRSKARDAAKFADHQKVRKRGAVLNRLDNTPERLRVKERLMQIAADKKERSL